MQLFCKVITDAPYTKYSPCTRYPWIYGYFLQCIACPFHRSVVAAAAVLGASMTSERCRNSPAVG